MSKLLLLVALACAACGGVNASSIKASSSTTAAQPYVEAFFEGRNDGRFCIDPFDPDLQVRNVKCYADHAARQTPLPITPHRMLSVKVEGDAITDFRFDHSTFKCAELVKCPNVSYPNP